MSILSEINTIKSKTFILGTLDVFFLFLPGVMSLFIFEREIFLSIDWLKLSLLSASIVAPFVFVNFVVAIVMETIVENPNQKLPKNTEDLIFFNFTAGIILTGCIMYTTLGISYFLHQSLSFAIFLTIIFEFFVISATKLSAMRVRKANKKALEK